MKEILTRITEVERVQDLMRTVINRLGNEVHELSECVNADKSDYEVELAALTDAPEESKDESPLYQKPGFYGKETPEDMVKNLIMKACDAAGVECIIEEGKAEEETEDAAPVTQAEYWQDTDHVFQVGLRFDDDTLNILGHFSSCKSGREYALETAFSAGVALFDMTPMGLVEQ